MIEQLDRVIEDQDTDKIPAMIHLTFDPLDCVPAVSLCGRLLFGDSAPRHSVECVVCADMWRESR